MSTATYPCRAVEVDADLLRELCGEYLAKFEARLEDLGATYADWVFASDGDASDFPHPEKMTSAAAFKACHYWYARLCNQFKQKTGLSIHLDQVREDRVLGDNDWPARTDGCYWSLWREEVYAFTPNARKIRKHIHTLEWVECG